MFMPFFCPLSFDEIVNNTTGIVNLTSVEKRAILRYHPESHEHTELYANSSKISNQVSKHAGAKKKKKRIC